MGVWMMRVAGWDVPGMTSNVVMPLVMAAVALLIFLIPLTGRITARRLGTFQTTVVEKAAERTVIYVGIFVPTVTRFLIVESGAKVSGLRV